MNALFTARPTPNERDDGTLPACKGGWFQDNTWGGFIGQGDPSREEQLVATRAHRLLRQELYVTRVGRFKIAPVFRDAVGLGSSGAISKLAPVRSHIRR